MPVFIIFCLAMAFIVDTGNFMQKVFLHPFFLYTGLALAILSIIGNFFRKIPEDIAYDLFSSSVLLAWFALWKPLFVKDSPIFFFFPVYFALMAALASLFFISQRRKIDKVSLGLMQSIVDSGVADPWMVMIWVLVTLYLENHFLQFPVAMTLLITRHTLSGCLKK